MKSPHAPSPLPLLVASLLASGCAAQKPADFRDVAKAAVDNAAENANLLEPAAESERTIRVTVDAERRVFFRKEQVGTTDEVGPLKERVRQAIERNRQAALDEGDKEAAGHADTVFVCAPPTFKYGDVLKAVDAIREAGGNPIGLEGCDPSRR